MRITEAQLRKIIRNVIKENLSPADEFRPDTVGKTSYVDPVEQSRLALIDKMERRRVELEKQGKKAFADELQAIFSDVLG